MSLVAAIQNGIAKYMDQKAPHLKRPAAMYAQITKAKQLDADTWVYNIKVLKENLITDSSYPEIPNIKSKLEIKSGKIVAVLLMYGQVKPFIAGEAFP